MLKRLTASYTLALLALIVVLGSCKKEYDSIRTTDDAQLKQYVQNSQLQFVADTSGFYYNVSNPATGDTFKNTDSVFYTVALKSLKNATVYFESPALGNLGTYVAYTNNFNSLINIPAIRTTMLALKLGGTGRILLPSYLAFGRNGYSAYKIPSNELLELVVTTFPERSQAALDDTRIKAFIAAKNITGMVKHPSGVYYSIIKPGTGIDPINGGSNVTAIYEGRFLDGKVFDASTTGVNFALNQVVPAWTKIVPLLRVGGKVRILAPSGQAYGTAGQNAIPPNTVLDFDIEVTKLN